MYSNIHAVKTTTIFQIVSLCNKQHHEIYNYMFRPCKWANYKVETCSCILRSVAYYIVILSEKLLCFDCMYMVTKSLFQVVSVGCIRNLKRVNIIHHCILVFTDPNKSKSKSLYPNCILKKYIKANSCYYQFSNLFFSSCEYKIFVFYLMNK